MAGVAFSGPGRRDGGGACSPPRSCVASADRCARSIEMPAGTEKVGGPSAVVDGPDEAALARKRTRWAYLGFGIGIALAFVVTLVHVAFVGYLILPVMLVCALLVRLTSRGPAFYSQVRLGRHGLPFVIYKLRTMTHNCEGKSGACWAKAPLRPSSGAGIAFFSRSRPIKCRRLWRSKSTRVRPRPTWWGATERAMSCGKSSIPSSIRGGRCSSSRVSQESARPL